ncbi:nucleotide-diphospho-sugar transferase [Pilobolus umbonatus]|nr:nucleotide-diphospho-sugar transferase [Pilobolus umbonatus]
MILVTGGITVLLSPNVGTAEILLRKIVERLDLPAHQKKLIAVNALPDTEIDWKPLSNLTTKAAFVSLVLEEDMHKLRNTMVDVESRFNHHHGYPWIIIGDKLFSNEFREWIVNSVSSPVYFGLAPPIEWQEPYWVDIKKAEKNLKEMVKGNSAHSESMSWRRMSRYNAGFMAFHPLLKDLEYYWKVHPGSTYSCNINDDPFQQMKEGGYHLSYGLSLTEDHRNIPTFEYLVKKFIVQNKDIVLPVKDTIYEALLNGDDAYFSNCHIWNNYMVVSLSFLRSREYMKFFDYLDSYGGFLYERWGDSFPLSVAAALFLNKAQIHQSTLTGYLHSGGALCPSNLDEHIALQCSCNPGHYGGK